MEFGIFNLMGARDPRTPTTQIFSEVSEQVALADRLGYSTAWFAEHHFSNYCMCASPLMMVAHCAASTTADAMSGGRLMLGVGAGYQPYEFERFGVDIKDKIAMTDEFLEILELAFKEDFFEYDGRHYKMPKTHIAARPVQKPLPIYVAGHTNEMFRAAARHGHRVITSGRSGGLKMLADQYADFATAFAAEKVPMEQAHMTVNRVAMITNNRAEGMKFAENARYQTRL